MKNDSGYFYRLVLGILYPIYNICSYLFRLVLAIP